MSVHFLRRLLLAAVVTTLLALRPAMAAVDYTDLWWTPSESGWGVNLVQADDFLFATFFIYDEDNQPGWISGQIRRSVLSATELWRGDVYYSTGTHYALPWKTADSSLVRIGEVNFIPTSASEATLTYSINNFVVTKSITRQTLTPLSLAGKYAGGLRQVAFGCANTPPEGLHNRGTVEISVTHPPSGPLTLALSIVPDAGNARPSTYTISGVAVQQGMVFRLPDATATAVGDGQTVTSKINVLSLQRTSLGIEYETTVSLGGCTVNTQVSALAVE